MDKALKESFQRIENLTSEEVDKQIEERKKRDEKKITGQEAREEKENLKTELLLAVNRNLNEIEKEEEIQRIAKHYGKKITGVRKEYYRLMKQENNFSNPISFDYEIIKPDEKITSLKQVEAVIKKNFPSIWFEVKGCLSTYATLSLKNLNGCPSLNLIGNPSGEKTTALSFFYGHERAYISDDLTPKAFVSHSANAKEEELQEIDLLPKLRNKALITPELAPLFEGSKDKLVENFAMLTRILDGEGLNRDSGTHGHRGYSGDYKFAWLGASTPLRPHLWNLMGKIGNRLFFLNMREKKRSDNDYLEMFRGKAYEKKVKECRGVVVAYLDYLFDKNPIRTLEWDAEGDIFLLPEIIKYAKLLSRLRGSLMIWKGEEKGTHEFSFPIIEEPPRAINSLYNFAKGHALIHGRNFLKSEDLELIKAVCFSSMPHDRYKFFELLAKHEGKLTTRQIESELNCSQDTALRTMKVFEVLGVVKVKRISIDSGSFGGRPLNYIEINPEFQELLDFTQGDSDAINPKSQENDTESDKFSNIRPEDFIESKGKNSPTHPKNDAINPKSHETNPEREEFKPFEIEEEKIK